MKIRFKSNINRWAELVFTNLQIVFSHSPVVLNRLYVLYDLGVQLSVERVRWMLTARLWFEQILYPEEENQN